jgi:hypothetical protein
MLNLTYVCAVFGIGIFGFGVYGMTYMNFRVQGINNFLRPLSDLRAKYRRLVKEGGAPAWPLIVSAVCMPVGILIAFAAVLFSK